MAVTIAAAALLGGAALGSPAAVGSPTSNGDGGSGTQNFIVLAPKGNGVAAAIDRVRSMGGSVTARYDAIGVLIARSDRADFATAVPGDGVQSAAATTGMGSRLNESATAEATVATLAKSQGDTGAAATDEPDWSKQWDMRAMDTARAHEVTAGSSDVVVGVLDSGIFSGHPDLTGQVDASQSAGCLDGAPDTAPTAWQPTTSDHGTHVAGTIAAARNGVGMSGVAPGVRLAAVKVVNDDGLIYPEAAVCGFMWAAEHGFDVTNNSYFIDPWEFNCRNDVRQRPIWAAVHRAIQHATSKGVLTVASAGNSNEDMAHKLIDDGSPNDGSAPPEERLINGACVKLPAEAPGVVAVSATGPTGAKSFYSSYGLGVVDVAAPGGDSLVQGSEPNGRVYSTTWSRTSGAGWGYKQGTSMAGPHVAGLAALVRSVHPDINPNALTAAMQRSADAQEARWAGRTTRRVTAVGARTAVAMPRTTASSATAR
ncbi:MAG: S8 family peptidase [Micromonosporaceae bacterium]